MGYEPVWQDVEPTDGGELLAVLRQRMAPCQLMIQLVGSRYGAEPPVDQPPPTFGRVSFTQYEALHFESLGRKVIYCFLDPTYPVDPASPESAELTALQAAYRRQIERANRLHQAGIAGATDLELSMRRLSSELSELRRKVETRDRRMRRLISLAAVGIVVLGLVTVVGYFVLRRSQQQTQQTVETATTDQSEQLARIEKLLVSQKQVNPQAASVLSAADQAILDEARKQGDLKSRAAASVLSPDANTDALLTELQSQQDAQAFDLAMLNGKRWYFARPFPQYDNAVQFFERAMELRPDSTEARIYTASVNNSARLESPEGLRGLRRR